MTVFHPISTDRLQTYKKRDLADDMRGEMRPVILINPAGRAQGKLDEQLRGLDFEPEYLPEDLAALDELEDRAGHAKAVILDWRADGAKDRAFAETLAERAAEAGLPVLTLAVTDRTNDIQVASEAGLSTILSMPCRLADVKSALETLMRRTQLAEETPDIGLEDAAELLDSCKFRFRTPKDIEKLVPIVARLFPDPERSAAGLAELMMNAIEHGNLEIGHERKAEWVARGIYGSELQKRLQTPPYSQRRAELIVNRRQDGIVIVIMDEGCGFCWQDVVSDGHGDANGNGVKPRGEGLLKARRESFDELRFNHIGNQVTAFVGDGQM